MGYNKKVVRSNGLTGRLCEENGSFVIYYDDGSIEKYKDMEQIEDDSFLFFRIGETLYGNKVPIEEVQREYDKQKMIVDKENAKLDLIRKRLFYLNNAMTDGYKSEKKYTLEERIAFAVHKNEKYLQFQTPEVEAVTFGKKLSCRDNGNRIIYDPAVWGERWNNADVDMRVSRCCYSCYMWQNGQAQDDILAWAWAYYLQNDVLQKHIEIGKWVRPEDVPLVLEKAKEFNARR